MTDSTGTSAGPVAAKTPPPTSARGWQRILDAFTSTFDGQETG